MSEKELGQTAYDAAFDDVSPAFADAPPEIRYHWSVIETAVRNAALEEAARIVERMNGKTASIYAAAIRAAQTTKDPDAS